MTEHVIFILPKKYYGGMETSNQKLMDYFAKWFSVKVSAYIHKGGVNEEAYRCDESKFVSIMSLYLSVCALFKDRNKLLFIINGVFPLICMMLVPFKVKAVYQLHCTLTSNGELKYLKRIFLKGLIALSSWRFDIYCVSESLALEVQGYKCSRKANIKFSPNVVDACEIKSLSKSYRALFVGRISQQKNPFLALKILNQLILSGQIREALMVGKGNLVDNVKLKASEQIQFPGWLSNPYSHGGVVLFTSNYEGYGLVVIEALLNGCLVLARDAPYGPRDILNKIDTDMLIPYEAPHDYYIEQLRILNEKYSSAVECKKLKVSISRYIEYLNKVRYKSWAEFF
ncbi:MAG: hypothetical protein CMH98_15780 [Oceanospirillaceae bacterium]|nr:hypothetical protein [Oceanospirillaceae bacterium]|tara:strand:+ start:71764 stop:72789 length:1026 start_codon:yes stop_codon:yes gene_type:complete